MTTDIIALSRSELRTHGRTFWLAAHFLAPDKRDDAAVVYAFCRMVDDIADEAEVGVPPEQVSRDLDAVRDELLGYTTARPLVAEFVRVCTRLQIPYSAPLGLIEGCRQDTVRVRFRSQKDVVRYAYRVAGTVGIMMSGVLGVEEPEAMAHAVDLGVGMQLTNICRDVLADAEIDRIYVPDLSLSSDHAMAILERQPDQVAKATHSLLDLADLYYRSAVDGFHYIPFRSRIAIAIAAIAYQSIGLKVRARNYAFQAPRAVVGRWKKAWCVGAGLLIALYPPRRARHNKALHRDLDGIRPKELAAAE